jgi:hypothetical protein
MAIDGGGIGVLGSRPQALFLGRIAAKKEGDVSAFGETKLCSAGT